MTRRLSLLLCSAVTAGCIDGALGSESTVDRPRVIAVLSDPPESAPGAQVRFRAIVAAPDGPSAPPLTWSFCSTPRAVGDNTAAAQSCVLDPERSLGATATVDLAIPLDACMRFGSETPSGRAPNAADATGGYYQPLRVALGSGDVTIMRQRVLCALPNAPLAAVRAFTRDYVPNRAPRITVVRAFIEDGEVALPRLGSAAGVTLRIEIAADAQEPYLFYDPRAGSITTRKEKLSTSWYVTSGAFEHATLDVEGVAVENRLQTNRAMPRGWLWIVLRDDRGAMAVEAREFALDAAQPQ